jgi:NLI interacting factor-like phosphatase
VPFLKGLLTNPYVFVDEKVQVTKDLQKLWAVFPHHTSATTILLDDSASKARFQPYNHLCVSDYDKTMHTETKAVLEAVQAGVECSTRLDQTLLAVIGILETLREEPDVASWIRRGSLLKLASSCPSHTEAPAATAREVAKFTFWWEQPDAMEFWIRAGRSALQRLEINMTV